MVIATRNSGNIGSSNGSTVLLDDETKRYIADTIVAMMEGALTNM